MQFSDNWLRTMVDPDMTTDELAHLMTMSGLEVEEVIPVAKPFSKIVVAEVIEVAKHPNADRLSVCQVDAGTGTILNIVCGAPNVRPGMKTGCALVGAVLPPGEDGKPFSIKKGKLRGVESNGMLCSFRELQLSEDHSGIMDLPEDAPVGSDLREYLQLEDSIFDIKLTPNKADCLSLLGVAREVSALTGTPLAFHEAAKAKVTSDARQEVNILAPDLCGRFSGRVIRNINAKAATPEWMKQRLERSGQRSVSALVDISNYVMLECGQPNHIYDLDRIAGPLNVRWGEKGETVELLNGMTVEVDDWVGVIVDENGVESLGGSWGETGPPFPWIRKTFSLKPLSGGRMPFVAVPAGSISQRMPPIALSGVSILQEQWKPLNGLPNWFFRFAGQKERQWSGLWMTRL